ncbi:MAG TPA: pilus assembly protein N-terminal domain-containing protein [Longimicrobiales bacterium]|nr:pilus assembly protein N-terminal domain-containing protein [Longimicrobiales bacterium]
MMRRSANPVWGLVLAFGMTMQANAAAAQRQQVLAEADDVIRVAKGKSALILQPAQVERIQLADPTIAEATPISVRELVVTGVAIGTTSLFVWRTNNTVSLYTVEVTPDADLIQRQIEIMLPGETITVLPSGTNILLNGNVTRPGMARRAVEIAEQSGATVVNNIQSPSAEQILLSVRFAEVTNTGGRNMASALRTLNPHELQFDDSEDWFGETISDGLLTFLLSGDNRSLEAIIQTLKETGDFKSLAEPNLLTIEGNEATFLAGGEFPFPILQGNQAGGVTIQFREFGIRLKFTPFITNTGAIRLQVEPEVSSLDFANGLVLSGFRIPTILSRKTSTEVELREGQTLAISGLVSSEMAKSVTKIPILGDIPILGAFFRSTDAQQSRSELLVTVTPYIVQPSDVPPEMPTGEPETWDWLRGMRDQDLERR